MKKFLDKVTPNKKTSKELEEEKLVQLIKTYYNKAKEAKQSEKQLWGDCEKAYTGELFKSFLPDYRADLNSNYVFSTIETVKPIMLAQRPTARILPRTDEQFDKAVMVQHAINYEWQRERIFDKLVEMSHHVLVKGTAVMGVLWNQDEYEGLGNVNAVVIDPHNFFPNPGATSVEDAEYVIYAVYKPVEELIQVFPEKAEKLRESASTPQDTDLVHEQGESDNTNQILYLECYFRDYKEDTIQRELEDGDIEEVTVKKYPKGRRVIIAGDTVVYDGENPYEDGRFPFEVWKCYSNPGKFWGRGEVESLISPQKHLNGLMNSIIDSAYLMGNPIWIMDKNSGVEKGSLSNRRGLVIRKNPGTEVRREAPPAMPAYIKDLVNTIKMDIEQVSGVFDVTRGERPGGVTAASAIQALTENSQGRIRLKVQLMETFITKLGELWLSRMQQYWDVERNIRVMGADYLANSGVIAKQMERELAEQGVPVEQINQQVNQYMMMARQNQMTFYKVGKDEVDGDYDLEVVAGATMQYNRQNYLQTMVQMAQTMAEDGLPMIDRHALLTAAEIPDAATIVDRFNVKAQQQQEAQQQQLQAQMQQQQQAEQMKMQELQMKAQIDQQKAQMDMSKEQLSLQTEQAKAQLELQIMQLELQIKTAEAKLKLQAQAESHALQMQQAKEKSEIAKKEAKQKSKGDKKDDKSNK